MSLLRHQTRLLAVALSAAVVLGAPAAHAERTVTEDAAGDVVAVTLDGDDEEVQLTPAPEVTDVDITRTVVDHRAARLRVSVDFRDLRAKPWHFTFVRVHTPERNFHISVDRSDGPRKGTATLVSSASLTSKSGPEIECRGLRWLIDRDADRVTASLPTACLGTPRWVEVGVGASSVDPAASDLESMSLSADDGHRTGLLKDKDLRLGPRVHRG